MKIENFNKAVQFRFYIPLLIINSIVLFGFYFLNIEKSIVLIIIGSIFLLAAIYFLLIKPQYFSFESTELKIKIKFYSTYSFVKNYRAIEFDTNNLSGYEIKKSIFGKRKDIIFKIKKGNKEGSYKPISITLLNKNEIQKITDDLDFILKSNKI